MIRERPRRIPIRFKLEIIFSGTFYIVGLIFAMIGSAVLYFSPALQEKKGLYFLMIGLIIWGAGLILYTVAKGLRHLKVLQWGKIIYGKLVEKEPGYRDVSGQISYKAVFHFPLKRKQRSASLDIMEAYNMDIGKYYLLLVDEDHPGNIRCLEQFSEEFIRYFLTSYHASAKNALREQELLE